jgi:hypothetical protein
MAKGNEDHDLRLELKLSKYIKEMDVELRERFQALKVMEDQLRKADEDEAKEIRKLEVEYETLYKDIYAEREAIVTGKTEPNALFIE